MMKISWDPESDVLLMLLSDDPPADAVEEPGGVIISYGEDGEPVSIEVLNASSKRLVEAGRVQVTVDTGSGGAAA